MATDDVPKYEASKGRIEFRHASGSWLIVFVVLGLLVVGEIYTLAKLGTISSVQAEQASLRSQVQQGNEQLSARLSSLQDANAQQLDALRAELDATTKPASSPAPNRALTRALARLEAQTKQQSSELAATKADLARKADTEQVAAVGQDVAATKNELGSTEKTVTTLQNDLGMAGSELGTLIARNHDDIDALRKLGQRNYYEFTLTKNEEQRVAGVGLVLKKTTLKRHRFNLNLLTDDMVIPKDNRTVDEPIFFTTGESRQFDELVINTVDQDKVAGYISTLKYSQPEPRARRSQASRT